jgi:TolB-like protein/Tfp pilus assembly protein PilF
MSNFRQLVIELRRRRVFRVAGFYVVGAWVLLQVAALAFQSLEIPDRALVWVWMASIVGFPLALVFGWMYDLTPDGIRRTPPATAADQTDLSLRRTDKLILTALAVIAVVVGGRLAVEIRNVEPDTASQVTAAASSVAVLPLDNLSGDPEQEYFVSGMHETLIADLARISGLKVISRTSAELYRDSDKAAGEIASELGVVHLIEGSVQRSGDRVRVNVQLIDAAEDETLWSESYDRAVVDVLRLQSDIARAIAGQVRVQLTPYEDKSLEASAATDPRAYELYLKGRFHWYRFTEADLQLAMEYFQQAIDQDPDYALAYVGFADALATPAHLGMMPTTHVYPAAIGYLDRALQLDPELAEAHDLRARISFAYDWDWDAAERGFRRAISLKPGYPDVHIVYSQFLGTTKRWDESLDEVRAGLALDPLNPWYRLEEATRLFWFGRGEEALDLLRQIVADQPDFHYAWEIIWDAEYSHGNTDAAIDAAIRYFDLLGEEHIVDVIHTESESLDYHELMVRVAETLETNSVRQYLSHFVRARMWMIASNIERAMDLLEQGYAAKESSLVYSIADPVFEPLWATPRYRDLLGKMNYRY